MKTLAQIGCETFWMLLYPGKSQKEAEEAWNGESAIDHRRLWNAATEAIIQEHTARALAPSGAKLVETPKPYVSILEITRSFCG